MATPSDKLSAALEKKLSDIELNRQEEEYKSKASGLGLPFVDLKKTLIDIEALATLDEAVAKSSNLVPFSRSGNKVAVAVIDPTNTKTKEQLDYLSSKGFSLKVFVTSPNDLAHALERYKDVRKIEAFETGSINISDEEISKFQDEIKDVSDLKNKVTQISTTRLLEVLIAGALKIKASDIHFEPEKESTRLRYRMDGVLTDVTSLKKEDYKKLVDRFKVLARLKLNITKAPQDGRFTIKQTSVSIEVRISILPGEFGETVVMRLLDPRSINQELDDLGIRPDLLDLIKKQLGRANGSIFTTGPTGSGKTTSLYAFVNYLNSPDLKIITIEDPIEYHVAGISQTQVEPDKGYTFASGLRAIVRQDPDVILVGEIRDLETAEIALNASLTGHIVLSTLHTNDAPGTIPRLIDLGVKPQIIAPALSMAIAQRLVRKLCPKCKKEGVISSELLKKMGEALTPLKDRLPNIDISSKTKIFTPGKCDDCNNIGFRGRTGVYEAFVVSHEIEKMILNNPSVSDIRDQAVKEGMVTMLQDGYIKILQGITSEDEIERVLG
jgi:type II secretory ATPase GspE/PulE/Tfp pilus assembly ATPase PilB-like protein